MIESEFFFKMADITIGLGIMLIMVFAIITYFRKCHFADLHIKGIK